jgi:hypothetical protein
MALTASGFLQAAIDAGITDQAQATKLFRLMLQQTLLYRQGQLASKSMSGTPLTAAETAESASNETILANLAKVI